MLRATTLWLLLASALYGDEPAKTKTMPRTLPGAGAEGLIRLPNQWAIRPAGKHIELGDFPVNSVLHSSGQWLAVLHGGHGDHELMIVELDPKRSRITSRAIIEQTFYGLCFSPDGKTLYASGGEFDVVHAFDFADGFLSKRRDIAVAKKKTFIPGGLAVDASGKLLCVAGTWGHVVALVPLERPDPPAFVPLGDTAYPYACLVSGKRLYVSLWNQAAVAVVDLDEKIEVDAFATEKHPTEMALSPDGKLLYVACANSTRVSVIRLADGKNLETIACALYPKAPNGNTPNSLALTPNGQMLFVANADANNVAVFNVSAPGNAKPLGFIPTGMYPTSVRFNPKTEKLYVVNGRGATPRANPRGPNPLLPPNATVREYIASLYRGTLSTLDVPHEERMLLYTKQAYACSPLREDFGVTGTRPKDNPIPTKIGAPNPIKYCIYVIRENRTYDQVFGDMKLGNGDPGLCIFPEKITPNAHRLARQFVLLDNFYCEGEVSAEGHEWSMGAYCTDFVKRMWPPSYRGSRN